MYLIVKSFPPSVRSLQKYSLLITKCYIHTKFCTILVPVINIKSKRIYPPRNIFTFECKGMCYINQIYDLNVFSIPLFQEPLYHDDFLLISAALNTFHCLLPLLIYITLFCVLVISFFQYCSSFTFVDGCTFTLCHFLSFFKTHFPSKIHYFL